MHLRPSALLSFLFLAIVLFGGTACSNYRLGTGAKLGFTKLYIAPVESDALLPQARGVVGARLREELLRDTRITLVSSADEAEAILQVTLRKYSREAVVSQTQDTGLGRKFALTLRAECTLQVPGGAQGFTQREIVAQREDFVDRGAQQAEYETLPLLAQDLSNKITHAVLDTW